MKQNRITVVINKKPEAVFAFVLDPQNTPRWIDLIEAEETNEWPARLGTVYRNRNRQGEWREYTVTAYEHNKMFVLSRKDGGYHVQYTVRPVGKDATELEYVEWEDRGEVGAPLNQDVFLKLKQLVEEN